MAKKNITIDELAVMVQKGFAKTTTKDELNQLRSDMNKHFEQVNKRLEVMVTKAEMNRRFDGLEDRVLASHQKRIEKLEAEVKELREMFAT